MRNPLTAVVIILTVLAGSSVPQARQRDPFEGTGAPTPRNRIDDLVFGRLKTRGVRPAPLSSDAVFVRRAYLDVIGTLPTAEEVRAFIADRDPDKRGALIDRLLEREEFADYWAMKWSDVLRVKSEFPVNLWPNAVQAYHRWIRASLRGNLPYDQFARQLLTESGSNFRVPQVNFYRAVQSREPQAIAQAVALTFMGARAEIWPKERLAGMAVFFSRIGYKPTGEWKEEIVYFDSSKVPAGSTAGTAREATFPDGSTARLLFERDPREVFASWLVSPNNPWFARNMANRVWFWLLGRGIVDEPDDIRPDNPPCNPDLLAFLERELTTSRWDLKHLYRLILNSATYQLSSIPATDRPGDDADFSHYLLRPLDAEVLVDAIGQITGTADQYSSPIPEPYSFMPADQRAIALPDGSISSAALETFGRPPRDTGRATERNNRPTAAQRLYLLNSNDIQRKLQQGRRLQALVLAGGDLRQMVTSLYLTILSRPPTENELKIAGAYGRPAAAAATAGAGAPVAGLNRRAIAIDLAWALINSAEFCYRH